MPALRTRETTAPAGVPATCWFADQAALDTRKAHWAGVLGGMTTASVVMWIVGLAQPPADAVAETNEHRRCLERGLRAASTTGPRASRVRVPKGKFVRSPHRDFGEQETRIWMRKFRFEGAKFDRITPAAAAACPGLTAGGKWKPGTPAHDACWASLSDDQKQEEILQASAAPGISRHHWGTDVDVLDPAMDPAKWETGGAFADAYSWLAPNAGSYGFVQTYTAMQPGGTGYIEERWHWSYYPVAQALLEFALAHQAEVEAELLVQWSGRPEFSFIQAHWREFMFNVNQAGRF